MHIYAAVVKIIYYDLNNTDLMSVSFTFSKKFFGTLGFWFEFFKQGKVFRSIWNRSPDSRIKCQC